MTLSRMHDELFLKDTRYACDFWEEHKENFKAMLDDLLTEESLLKILSVSKETSLMFNEKINALSAEDNEKLVRAAYDKIEQLIQPQRFAGPDGEDRDPFNGKKFLFDGMCSYFTVISLAKEESGKPLSDVFLEHRDKMARFLEPILPSGYTLDNALTVFAPQLLIYFSYLLWKYDQAMEGSLVSEYFNEFKRRKERMMQADKVQEIWSSIHDNDELVEEGVTPAPEGGNERGNASAGQKNEAWIFQESAGRQREAVEAFWTRKGSEIREKYEKKTAEEKEALLLDIRNVIADMGKGTYQNALMYCPELNPAKLSGIDTTPAPYSIHSFYDLVEYVLKQKELPKITPKNHEEIVAMVKDKDYGDDFMFTVSKKVGSSSLLPLVAVSRQHLLFIFCHLTFVQTLGLPLMNAIDIIPGCSDESPNTSESMNVPFSTREQRDATPIGKPPIRKAPIPDLAKKNQPQRKETKPVVPQPKIEEIIEDSNEQPKLAICSETSCGKQQEENEKFQVCSFCKKNQKSVPYCSRDCQIKHWRAAHKHECFKNKQ